MTHIALVFICLWYAQVASHGYSARSLTLTSLLIDLFEGHKDI